MTPPVSEFQVAIQQVCSGSREALYKFIEVYAPHLQRVVRGKLNQSLRAKFDSQDFMQMVWMSLFTDLKKLNQFKQPDELIAYLVAMASHKVIDESRRRMKYQKYNVNRESDLDASDPKLSVSARRNDTPSGEMMARERFDEVLGRKSDRDRMIFDLRMKGVTFVEIGNKLGISERTARQVMTDIERAFSPVTAEDP